MPRTSAASAAPATNIPRPGAAARGSKPESPGKRAAPGKTRAQAVAAAPAQASPPGRGRASRTAGSAKRGSAGTGGASSSAARNGAAAKQRKPATKAAAPVKIERKTMAMLALERLRERILHGDYPEGAPLRQDALAAELGVSRIPVREALRQLEAEGLVSFSPHVGAVVSSLSLDDIRELFDLRALLESELLRRAIAHMHEDDLERAAAVLAEYRAAFRRRDVAAWGALNREFHAALLEPAGQPLTMAILQNLLNQSDRYTRLQLSLTHGEDRAREEHSAILEAVRDCDAQRACALLASHILGAGRSLLEFLRAERGLAGDVEAR